MSGEQGRTPCFFIYFLLFRVLWLVGREPVFVGRLLTLLLRCWTFVPRGAGRFCCGLRPLLVDGPRYPGDLRMFAELRDGV